MFVAFGFAGGALVIGHHRQRAQPAQLCLAPGGAARRAGEVLLHLAAVPVDRHVPQHQRFPTAPAGKDVAPDRILDRSRAVAAVAGGAVEPVELLLDRSLDACELAAQGVDVHRRTVVAGDVHGGRREVVEHGVPPGQQGGDAGHAAAAEGVEHQVTGVGVVLDVGHDALWRDLGMVGVGVVDGRVFAGLDRRGKRRPAVGIARGVVGVGMLGQEVGQGGIGLGHGFLISTTKAPRHQGFICYLGILVVSLIGLAYDRLRTCCRSNYCWDAKLLD